MLWWGSGQRPLLLPGSSNSTHLCFRLQVSWPRGAFTGPGLAPGDINCPELLAHFRAVPPARSFARWLYFPEDSKVITGRGDILVKSLQGLFCCLIHTSYMNY